MFRACVQKAHLYDHTSILMIVCVWMGERAECRGFPLVRQLLLLSCSAFSFGEVKGCDVNCRQFAAEMCWPHAATHSLTHSTKTQLFRERERERVGVTTHYQIYPALTILPFLFMSLYETYLFIYLASCEITPP